MARQIELEMSKKRIREVLKRSRGREGATSEGAKVFEDALADMIDKGVDITDFEIDPGDYVNTRTMSNMATKCWADQVEEEELSLIGVHQNQ